MAASANWSLVESGIDDSTVRVWDAALGMVMSESLEAQDCPVWSVAATEVGTRIMTGGDDNRVRVWDSFAGTEVTEPLQIDCVAVLLDLVSAEGRELCRARSRREWCRCGIWQAELQ